MHLFINIRILVCLFFFTAPSYKNLLHDHRSESANIRKLCNLNVR